MKFGGMGSDGGCIAFGFVLCCVLETYIRRTNMTAMPPSIRVLRPMRSSTNQLKMVPTALSPFWPQLTS